MKEPNQKPSFRTRLQQRLRIENEPRFYFILQLIFALAQALLAYVAFLANNMQNTGCLLILLFGIAMMLLAGKAWQIRAVRVGCRLLCGMVILLFCAILSADAFTTTITESTGTGLVARGAGDYIGQIVSYLCKIVQPLLLVLFPAFAIAARRTQQKTDIRILQIGTWSLPLLAATTLAISYQSNPRIDFNADLLGISNQILLVVYLICTIAAVLSVFMCYPYGVKAIKRRVEKTRNQPQQKSA